MPKDLLDIRDGGAGNGAEDVIQFRIIQHRLTIGWSFRRLLLGHRRKTAASPLGSRVLLLTRRGRRVYALPSSLIPFTAFISSSMVAVVAMREARIRDISISVRTLST